MIKHYDIHVDREEIFSWVVGKNQISHPDEKDCSTESHLFHETEKELRRQIERAAAEVESAAADRYLYSVFSLQRPDTADSDAEDGDSYSSKANSSARDKNRSKEESIYLAKTSLVLTGSDICSLLHDCGSCILLAVTLGAPLDRILKKTQISDMSDAFLLDLCASSAAEELCNAVNRTLEEEFENRGYFLTDRFSPGYGDLPIRLQGDICRVLQAEKRIGLTVNSCDMLIPSKSITAVIGIADRPQPKKISGCQNCRMKETCGFRKAGKTCE